MTQPRRLLAVAGITALSAAALAGCQLVRPNVPEYTPTSVEACMGAHEWDIDPATLASSTVGALADLGVGVAATAQGTQVLHYTPGVGTITLDSDITITATLNGTAQVVTLALKGTSTGRAYFSDSVAIPRQWDDTQLTQTPTYTDNGQPNPKPTWSIPHAWLDDTVGWDTTCTDDTLTLAARGTHKAWTFHSPGWTPSPAPTPAG